MKTKAALLALFALGLTASVALSAPTKGKPPKGTTTSTTVTSTNAVTTTAKGHKPPKTGDGCKPRVAIVLGGTLVGAPGAAGTSLTMTVTKSNRFGRVYRLGAQPVTIQLDQATKFRRNGAKTRAALQPGDRLLVQARACKGDLTNNAAPALTAKRVVAHPPAKGKGGDDGTTTTTS